MAVHTFEWAGDWIARVDVTNDSLRWLAESSHSMIGRIIAFIQTWAAAHANLTCCTQSKIRPDFHFSTFPPAPSKVSNAGLMKKRMCHSCVFFNLLSDITKRKTACYIFYKDSHWSIYHSEDPKLSILSWSSLVVIILKPLCDLKSAT